MYFLQPWQNKKMNKQQKNKQNKKKNKQNNKKKQTKTVCASTRTRTCPQKRNKHNMCKGPTTGTQMNGMKGNRLMLILFCCYFAVATTLTNIAGEPGLSSQMLSPQSNPGASPGWRIGE